MSHRGRQARETRRRIVEAAALLFVRDGYSATSISAIAERAGVAVPTVYASLKSKANILRAVVDLTVRGDDEAATLASRADWKEMEGQADPHDKLALFARLHRLICDREAAVFAQLEAAAGADPEATELLAEHDRRRYETQRRLARNLHRRNQLRPGLAAREASRHDLDARQRAHLPGARSPAGVDTRAIRALASRAARGRAPHRSIARPEPDCGQFRFAAAFPPARPRRTPIVRG